MEEIITTYLSLIEQSRKKKTWQTYKFALDMFGAFARKMELTPETYALFLQSIVDKPATTQSVIRTAVLGLYSYYGATHAVSKEALKLATKQWSKKVKQTRPQFNREAIQAFVEYVDSLHGDLGELRDRAFVIVLVETGLRLFEACALDRSTIDWENWTADITGKGDVDARVRFSERAIDALKDYLTARQPLDARSGKPIMSLPLFARHDSQAQDVVERIGANGMWQSIKKRMAEAKMDTSLIRIHDFRHYFVTDFYEFSLNPAATKTAARHTNIKTTFRYIHSDEETDRLYHERYNTRKKK